MLDDHFTVEPRLGSGSAELRSLVKAAGANDTSMGVGYAPLSHLERDVFEIDRLVHTVRGAGEDSRIMAIRHGRPGAVHRRRRHRVEVREEQG